MSALTLVELAASAIDDCDYELAEMHLINYYEYISWGGMTNDRIDHLAAMAKRWLATYAV